MLNKKILKSILNVKHTAIDDMKILPDGTIAIKAHPTKGEQCRCGICGRKSVRYDNGRGGTRSWRTCDWNTHKVYIVADIHRVMCPKHGVVTASVPWARHKSRFTKEFEELATWLSLSCTKTAVASLLRISWNTIGPVISRMRAELDTNPAARFAGLVRIGVDETSYKKGHKYITVVINHDTGKVIWAHEGHGKTIFTKFFKLLSKEQLDRIQLVSGDGAKWIQEFFQCENVAIAKEELDGWIKWAQHCRIKVFVELQRKIRRHYDAILATMEHHLSNAVLEATNRKIKLVVYMAYGFRNIDNMIDMIMLRCSDIDVRLPWDYEAA